MATQISHPNFKAWYENVLMEINEPPQPVYHVNPITSHLFIISPSISSKHTISNPNLYHISYPSPTFDKGNPSYPPSISPYYPSSSYPSNTICIPPSTPNSLIHYPNPPSNTKPPHNPNPPKSTLSPSSKSLIHNLIQGMLAKETKSPPWNKVSKSPQVLHPPSSPPIPEFHDNTIPPSTQVKASIFSSIIQSPQLQACQELVPMHDSIDCSSPQDQSINTSHDTSPSQDPIIPPTPPHVSIQSQDQNIPLSPCHDPNPSKDPNPPSTSYPPQNGLTYCSQYNKGP